MFENGEHDIGENMTTDHTTAARGAMAAAHEFSGDEELAHADLALKTAQVHATLALVEQQRITNILALSCHADGDHYTPLIDAAEKGLGL